MYMSPASYHQNLPQLFVISTDANNAVDYLNCCFKNNKQFKERDLHWFKKQGHVVKGVINNEGVKCGPNSVTLPFDTRLPSWLYKNAPNESMDGSDKGSEIVSLLKSIDLRDAACNGDSKLCASLNSLEGHFSFALPNSEGNSLLLATSALNPETLFYCVLQGDPDAFCVSNDISVLLTFQERKACKTALSFWLAGRPDPNRSLYENIHQVPQGGYVVLTAGKPPTSGLFWDIDAERTLASSKTKEHYRLQNKFKEGLFSLISESVEHSLGLQKKMGGSTLFSQLSGGMDSTSVYALANTLSSQYDVEIHSVSHIYANTESADERSNIQAMLQRYPESPSHFIELDSYIHQSFKSLYPTHPQSPGMVMSPKYHQEAQLLTQHDAKVLLTGNGGDEMFWGHSLAYFDRLTSGNWKVVSEVMKSARQLNLPVINALRSVFLGPLKEVLKNRVKGGEVDKALASYAIPEWLTPKAVALIKSGKQRENPFTNSKNNLARYARYEGLFQTSTFNPMRSYQAVFNQYGLKVEHPLFNKDIAQFSFDVPQQLHISGAYPKLLLRKTMSPYLPEQVCWDKKKTVFDNHFAKLLRQNEEEIRELLSHEALADEGLVNNKVLLRSFDYAMSRPFPSIQVDLLYAILVQSWYQTHIL